MSTVTAACSSNAPWVGQCPDWCVVEHGDDIPQDVFHRSALAWLKPNDERSGHPGRWELAASIVAVEEPEDELDVPLLCIETQAGVGGPYVELDVEQVEEFIRQGKAFLARVEQMRDQLAATKEQQS
ncbi:hypothetical protein PV755_46675 [Streptomyces caniscabiei]|uniref:Uncharacterized protein n=1 Tax=Streptomyces caniscabiei TaxID=2746961 RepID=A0A927LJH2_9ACTN|nr:hypothetical protein [Streptomyces caniscabiei]MBD9730208.1 hypothetical protein [Streptomyces caniscabiei]MDX3516289.1 hypothetical protein [Streptomyces caniscabiei]MDX3725312.1 hypothetical protein [Streptomyces caniscabiei]WEO25161.1 hypothetical protein IHE65_19355 [Streptomyces caniscabiei]WEO26313.1 hypothetical protein IHE65_25880 [Streptomyces caniscabiei]